MKRKRKITLTTNDKIAGEQGLTICDAVYELLERSGVTYYDACSLKNIVLNVNIERINDKDVQKTKKSMRFEIFYRHPFAKGEELKISVFWNNDNLLLLVVKELSALKGEDKHISIYLPLQLPALTTFEELFARALIKIIQYCFELLMKQQCREIIDSVENHQKRLGTVIEDTLFGISPIKMDNANFFNSFN